MNSREASPTFRVSCATDVFSLADSAAAWNRLAAGVPFRQWEWVDSWWRHYRHAGMDAFIVTVHNGENELVGVLPCYAATESLAGRVLRFMGSGEICSDYLSLLAAPEHEQSVAEAVGRWLSEAAADAWDLIDLNGVAKADPAIQFLLEWLRLRGHTTHFRHQLNGWRIALPATWEDYLKLVSKGRRVRIRQIVKRQFETGRAVGCLATTAAEFQRGWEIFCDLHQRRRQSLGEKGCFASDRFADFHTEVAKRFFEAGQLRLHWVELEGVPIAIDYAFTGGEVVYCYQSGMDPLFDDEQPGWLDWTSSIRRAIDEGYRGFDFLRGDEPYKSTWRATPIPLEEIRIVNCKPTARLRDQAWKAGVAAKLQLGAAKKKVQGWLPKSTSPSLAEPVAMEAQ